MEKEVKDKIYLLDVKKRLLSYEKNKWCMLMDMDVSIFYEFVDQMLLLLKYDEEIMVVDKRITNKIYELINYKRFSCTKEYWSKINHLISRLNVLNSDRSKEEKRERYLLSESKKRVLTHGYSDLNEFLYDVINDANVYLYLLTEEKESTLSDESFCVSTCYFINTIPEIYTKQDLYENTINELKNIKKNQTVRHEFFKNIDYGIKQLNKIYTK